jgi:hypothetical protein
MTEEENKKYNKKIKKKKYYIFGDDGSITNIVPSYIPCPRCLKLNNFVTEIKSCDCINSEEGAGNIYDGRKM